MRALAFGSRRIAPLLCALLVCSVSASAESAAPGASARYIVFEVDDGGAVRPQMHRLVRLASAPRSLTPGEVEARLAGPFRGDERVRVRMFDAGGELAFEDVVAIPKWTRAEGVIAPDADGAGELDGRLLVSTRRSFVVRLPVAERSWLALSVPGEDGRPREAAFRDAEFDLDALAADSTLPLARVRAGAGAALGGRGQLRQPRRPAHHGRRLHRGRAGQVRLRRRQPRVEFLQHLPVQHVQELLQHGDALHRLRAVGSGPSSLRCRLRAVAHPAMLRRHGGAVGREGRARSSTRPSTRRTARTTPTAPSC